MGVRRAPPTATATLSVASERGAAGTMYPQDNTTIFGRDRELRVVRARLDDAVYGRAGIVLVTGEPGVGKSRLLDAGARLATGAGFAVAAATCWEGQGALPLWPWI